MDINMDLDMLWRMLLAVLLGGIIGIEREWFNKSAGLRTMILICMGATAFTMCSQQLGNSGDHSRIASNIVVGVGFIGGGVIFKGDSGVNGITTAACIWVTAAIGMLIGSMHWELACIVTGVVIIVLFLLSFAEKALDRLNSVRYYRITLPEPLYSSGRLYELIRESGLKLRSKHGLKEGGMLEANVSLQGRNTDHEGFVRRLSQMPEILKLRF